jgi:cytoskeleton protein RodZ
MTETASTSPSPERADREYSAGGLIRAERERQGLHIAALAAAIKVAPRKLDALENNRWAELPDPTFTRALAHTVCRSLKMDPKPVLDRMPIAESTPLENHAAGLNAPFNDRGGEGAAALMGAIKPLAWAGVLLMVAAVALYAFPPGWLPKAPSLAVAPTSQPASAVPLPASAVPAASAVVSSPVVAAASQAASSASAVPEAATAVTPMAAVAATPAPAASAALPSAPPLAPAAPVVTPTILVAAQSTPAAPPTPAALPAPPAPPALVQLRVRSSSWVEARDGRGRLLLSRVVESGEELGLDGALPIRMTIGNAQATTLAFRGQPVDLQPSTRDNVARVQLQ